MPEHQVHPFGRTVQRRVRIANEVWLEDGINALANALAFFVLTIGSGILVVYGLRDLWTGDAVLAGGIPFLIRWSPVAGVGAIMGGIGLGYLTGRQGWAFAIKVRDLWRLGRSELSFDGVALQLVMPASRVSKPSLDGGPAPPEKGRDSDIRAVSDREIVTAMNLERNQVVSIAYVRVFDLRAASRTSLWVGGLLYTMIRIVKSSRSTAWLVLEPTPGHREHVILPSQMMGPELDEFLSEVAATWSLPIDHHESAIWPSRFAPKPVRDRGDALARPQEARPGDRIAADRLKGWHPKEGRADPPHPEPEPEPEPVPEPESLEALSDRSLETAEQNPFASPRSLSSGGDSLRLGDDSIRVPARPLEYGVSTALLLATFGLGLAVLTLAVVVVVVGGDARRLVLSSIAPQSASLLLVSFGVMLATVIGIILFFRQRLILQPDCLRIPFRPPMRVSDVRCLRWFPAPTGPGEVGARVLIIEDRHVGDLVAIGCPPGSSYQEWARTLWEEVAPPSVLRIVCPGATDEARLLACSVPVAENEASARRQGDNAPSASKPGPTDFRA